MSNEDKIKFAILNQIMEIQEMKPISELEYLQSYYQYSLNPPKLNKKELEWFPNLLDKFIEKFGEPVKIDEKWDGYIWFKDVISPNA